MAERDMTSASTASKSPSLQPGHGRTSSPKESLPAVSYEAAPLFRAVTASPSTPFREGLDSWEGLDAEDYARSNLFGTFRTSQTPQLLLQHTPRVAGVEDLFGVGDAEDIALTPRSQPEFEQNPASISFSPSTDSVSYDAQICRLEQLLGQLRSGSPEVSSQSIQTSLSDVMATVKSQPSMQAHIRTSQPLVPQESVRTSRFSTPATPTLTATPALSEISIASSMRSASQVLHDLKTQKNAAEAKLKVERARIKTAKAEEAELRSASRKLWKMDEQKLKAEKEQQAVQQRLDLTRMKEEHRQHFLESEKIVETAIIAERAKLKAAQDARVEDTVNELQAIQSPVVCASGPSAATDASPATLSVTNTGQTVLAAATPPAAQINVLSPSGVSVAEREKIYRYLSHLQHGGQPMPGYENLLQRYNVEHADEALPWRSIAVRQANDHSDRLAQATALARDTINARAVQSASSSSEFLSPLPPLVPFASTSTHLDSDMGTIAASLLLEVVEDCEEARHVAYARHLDFMEVAKAKLVELTLVAEPKLLERVNSTRKLVVSIYPLPVLRNPKFREILYEQLRAAVSLFQLASLHLGAQAITNLRFHQGNASRSANLGKVAGLIVQYKTLGPGAQINRSPLNTSVPFSLHKRVPLPPGVLKKDYDYELFIETID